MVWAGRDLSTLPSFWTADCVNHADPMQNNVGLDALRAYHESFFVNFLLAFSAAFGHAPTGRNVSLASIRIDRFVSSKIAEHWSVADMAGFLQQLQAP